MIFTSEYTPVIEDYTKTGKLSISAVLKILENAGNRHSDFAGDSVFKAENIQKAWVLTDWQIEIKDYPVYGENIKTQTWSEELSSPLVASRNFIVYKNNAEFCRASSRWVLLDLTSGRLCRIEKELLEKYKPENKAVFENSKLSKIEIPETFDLEKKIELRRKDIDFNQHVHNLVYLDYAMECLPVEKYENEDFKKIRINYKSAVKSSKEVLCKYSCKNNINSVLIFDEEGKLCTSIELSE